MRDTEFVAELLRLKSPWTAKEAKLDLERQRVDATLEWQGPGLCPECGREALKHDHRERSWRDLDLCGDELYINARVPRIDCPQHGVHSVSVPWAQGRTAFTAQFERMVILLLREMSITAVSRRMRISWNLIDGILQRAVDRGLEARQEQFPRFIGIDEKAFIKGHKYFTIVSDLEAGKVLWIGKDRTKATIDRFWKSLSPQQFDGIEGVAMDMWRPYFESTVTHLPDAAKTIVFDTFHIASYLSKAVDQTRRTTVRHVGKEAGSLKGTTYDWLRNPKNMSRSDKREFEELRKQHAVVGRA